MGAWHLNALSHALCFFTWAWHHCALGHALEFFFEAVDFSDELMLMLGMLGTMHINGCGRGILMH